MIRSASIVPAVSSVVLLAACAAPVHCVETQDSSPASDLRMVYDRAADDYGVKSSLQAWLEESPDRSHKANPDKAWERYALPLGNGSLGAMVYGGTNLERVQLNIDSLWSGGPGSEGWIQHALVENAHTHLDEIRSALLQGDKKTAQKLSNEWLQGDWKADNGEDRNANDIRFGRYQTFGEMTIETGHANKDKVSHYQRELDLSTGVHSVRYSYDSVEFKRESFVSYPDNCAVMHYSSDVPGSQNLVLKIASPHKVKGKAVGEFFVVDGVVENNGLKLDVRIGILNEGGTVEVTDQGIQVQAADKVTLVLVGDTDYAATMPTWRGEDPAGQNQQYLDAALKQGYSALRQRHIEDHSALHSRVAIELGTTSEEVRKLPLDQRVLANKKTPDPDLEELYFQFGRYMLIASSRPGSLPANLQGIWCNEVVPAWNADYHLNINLQMNYWPSGPCNLSECQEPLIDYINVLRAPGAETARQYNNADGWTAHLSSNIWGYTTPHPGKNRPRYWSYFPLGGAWLSTHAYEQYAFTSDADYLRERSWPIISGTADFLVDYLYELPDGTLSSTPSWSPEHGPISLGATADIAMAREALENAICAADVLGETGARIDGWKDVLSRLTPYKIGKHGQLQEWYEDIDNPKDKHRHLNHLFGLYPGSQISPVHTPELAKAAGVTLTQRGDGATGWSMGWKINFWARMHDGDHAYKMIRNLLKNGTSLNLLDMHPPFQIDGNFGGTAGIAEMLVQSQSSGNTSEINLLPALPSAWSAGSVSGLVARGNTTVDITWENGVLVAATLHPSRNGKITVRFGERVWHLESEAGKMIKLEI